jgi:hypothetical protein
LFILLVQEQLLESLLTPGEESLLTQRRIDAAIRIMGSIQFEEHSRETMDERHCVRNCSPPSVLVIAFG